MATMKLPTTTLTLMRDVVKSGMRDICQLRSAIGTNQTISGSGILTQTAPNLRSYEGSTDIPCNIEISRAFRPGNARFQEVVIDNYNLELPYDVTIDETDTVILNGDYYEIRKLKAASAFDITVEAGIFFPGGVNLDKS